MWNYHPVAEYTLEQKPILGQKVQGSIQNGGQIFIFLGTVEHFVAWPPMWEIHTELCIIVIVQFASWFLQKSQNKLTSYDEKA